MVSNDAGSGEIFTASTSGSTYKLIAIPLSLPAFKIQSLPLPLLLRNSPLSNPLPLPKFKTRPVPLQLLLPPL